MTITESRVDERQQNEFQSKAEEVKSRAYRMAMQLTRNPSDAEDLVQETLIKAWRAYDSYIPGRPFLNWLLKIMQRAYLDVRRRANPIRRAESLQSMVSPSDGEIQEIPITDDSPSPEEELFHQEWTRQLHLALDELPPVYRSAIVMADLEELTYAEIADAQQTTIGTVRSRIHRGRKLLREIIQKKGIRVP